MKLKLSKADVKIFVDKVHAIPTHKQFVETQNYVGTAINKFQ